MTSKHSPEHACECGTAGFEYCATIVAPEAGRRIVLVNAKGDTEIRYPTCAMVLSLPIGRACVLASDSVTTMADWDALCGDLEAYGVTLADDVHDAGHDWYARHGFISPPAQRN
jgi:hypothetical protein